ncbi:DUF58 domain-containing protein [Fusibacter tunisiensis]|uniref:Uncharacterized protein (DUF58 family) n=1 Tax=Fusibacter tunisiensis TaxID=1008308 RepID=A0ABS2MNJ1_9FIRM|nr:DUF58 domain-containing protein [Fusibacter tunisiensis]MBM7560960.1 uncharacterized protein (DUF58 family) [Fusibacter tunisiensis]
MTKLYKLAFHILLSGVSVIAILSGAKTIYYFALVLITVRVGAYLMVKHHQKNIFVLYYTSEKNIETGDRLEVEYKVSNTSMIPIAHSLIEFKLDNKMNVTGKLKEMAFFGSQAQVNFTKHILCKRRGYYKVGQVSVSVFDPLLLEQRSVFFDKEIDVVVHPRVVSINGTAFHPKDLYGTLKSNRKTLEDRTNLVNIRPYTQGDQMKNIHWKLSAKKDTLLTKEFEQTVSSKLVLLVDGSVGHFENGYSYDQEELLVSFAASLVKAILDEGMQIRMVLNDGEQTQVETASKNDFSKVLESLTQFQSVSEVPFDVFTSQFKLPTSEDENLVMLTPFVTPQLRAQIDRPGATTMVFTFSGNTAPMRYIKAQYIDQILGVTAYES